MTNENPSRADLLFWCGFGLMVFSAVAIMFHAMQVDLVRVVAWGVSSVAFTFDNVLFGLFFIGGLVMATGAAAQKWKKKPDRESGVSPVIGVILMVAIVVILAAVIAAFVFGLAGSVPEGQDPCTPRGDPGHDPLELFDIRVISQWTPNGLVRIYPDFGVVCFYDAGCIQNFTLTAELCNCSGGGP